MNLDLFIQQLKANKAFVQFIFIVIFVYLVWSICNSFLIIPDGQLDKWLKLTEATFSSKLLNGIGLATNVFETKHQAVIFLSNQRLVGISDSCNGLSLMVLYSGFLLAFPGDVKAKILFIPLGAIMIYIVNIIRISSLALISLKAPEFLDFNHHYTFTILVYALVFLGWIIFVNKFGLKPKPIEK